MEVNKMYNCPICNFLGTATEMEYHLTEIEGWSMEETEKYLDDRYIER